MNTTREICESALEKSNGTFFSDTHLHFITEVVLEKSPHFWRNKGALYAFALQQKNQLNNCPKVGLLKPILDMQLKSPEESREL
jgi:hypothetical protein